MVSINTKAIEVISTPTKKSPAGATQVRWDHLHKRQNLKYPDTIPVSLETIEDSEYPSNSNPLASDPAKCKEKPPIDVSIEIRNRDKTSNDPNTCNNVLDSKADTKSQSWQSALNLFSNRHRQVDADGISRHVASDYGPSTAPK